jgi:hypothetical protein
MVVQWCNSGVAMVVSSAAWWLAARSDGVITVMTKASHSCYNGDTDGVTMVLQWCNSHVAVVLPSVVWWLAARSPHRSAGKYLLLWCHNGVTMLV